MNRYMYDSINPNDIPQPGTQMVAVYRNGNYAADLAAVRARFPDPVVLLTIDVNGSDPTAQIRDWESGDYGGNLEQWVIASKASGNKWPTIYCSRDSIAQVRVDTGSQVLNKDYWLWVATLDNTYATEYPDAPTGVVAVQYQGAEQLGFNADRSIVFYDSWYPGYVAPTAPQPKMLREVQVVATYSDGSKSISTYTV